MVIRLNVREAKTHLSRYLKELAKGETILLCKYNKPIAEIRPVTAQAPRGFGSDKGKAELGPEFFEPLPDELLRYFDGDKP